MMLNHAFVKPLSMVLHATSSIFCFVGIVIGWMTDSWMVACLAASVGLGCLMWSVLPRAARPAHGPARRPSRAAARAAGGAAVPEPAEPVSSGDQLVQQLLRQGRYALLLRPQIAERLNPEQLQAALEALRSGMSRTPAGPVELLVRGPSLDEALRPRQFDVSAFFLDRYPVTNQDYQLFVAAGGYQDPTLWDEQILGALDQLVDQTGQPGPRFWSAGVCPPGQEHHPVVGVSWYEAAAYARWVGKRLPSDAEWVKAAAWPVQASGRLRQRRFPWGNTMDRSLANLWGSGPGATVPVTEFSAGVSMGGVYQLIGNVWEWMHNDFGAWDDPAARLETEETLKSVRGGAFDTYFETQATCHFQSGERCLERKPNIGFRCAIAAADLVADASRCEQLTAAGQNTGGQV